MCSSTMSSCILTVSALNHSYESDFGQLGQNLESRPVSRLDVAAKPFILPRYMSVISELTVTVGVAFEAAGHDAKWGAVVVSGRPDLGQFQCNGALPAAKSQGLDPRELAEAVVAVLSTDRRFDDVSIAGPGFINLTLTDEALGARMSDVSGDERLGIAIVDHPLKVIVDYAGPNVAKSMHAGHLRATIIGESLKRLFRYAGHQVLGDAHFGDWGLQMGMLIVATRERLPDLPYFAADNIGPFPSDSPVTLNDLEVWYPDVSTRVETDDGLALSARQATTDLQMGRPGYVALWEHFVRVSRESQERDFGDLGVDFDLWYGKAQYEIDSFRW